MPEEFKDVTEPDPSTGQDAGAEAKAEVHAAEPSTATDEVKDEGALSVVRNVVDERKAKSPEDAASSADGKEDKVRGSDGKFVSQKEPDNENYSDVPFNKHPRFQEVIGKLRTAKRDLEAASGDAQRYRDTAQYVANLRLGGDEAKNALDIAGLTKSNPQEAWNRLLPIMQALATATGQVLPDDLRQRVQAGEISPDLAKEFSQQRAQARLAQQQQVQQQEQWQLEQQNAFVRSCQTAAQNWENDRRIKDPNFEAKAEPLRDRVSYLMRAEGYPKSVEAAVDQLNRAYQAVSRYGVVPSAPKPAIRPITGGQVAGNARPEIRSTEDIVRSVVAKRA